MSRLSSLTFALLTAVATSPAFAQEKSAPDGENTPIPDLVRQLDDDQFNVRESAARNLELAGAEAVPDLVEAAATGGAEVQRRSLGILQKVSSDADEPTVAALKKIEESGSPESAEIAKSLLKFVLVVFFILCNRYNLGRTALARHFVGCADTDGSRSTSRPLHDAMHGLQNVFPVKLVAYSDVTK